MARRRRASAARSGGDSAGRSGLVRGRVAGEEEGWRRALKARARRAQKSERQEAVTLIVVVIGWELVVKRGGMAGMLEVWVGVEAEEG